MTKCLDCKWWDNKEWREINSRGQGHAEFGLCRVNPPTMENGHWPSTRPLDWCKCYEAE